MSFDFAIRISSCLLLITLTFVREGIACTAALGSFAADVECEADVTRALPFSSQSDGSTLDGMLLTVARGPLEQDENVRCVGVFLNAVGSEIQARAGTVAAESFVRHSIAVLVTAYGSDNRILIRPFQILISWCLEQGEISKANQAFDEMRRIFPRGRDDTVILLITSALIASCRGDHAGAEQHYLAGLQLLDGQKKRDNGLQAGVLNNLATLYLLEGRRSDAQAALVRAEVLARTEPNRNERERLMVGVLGNLGTVLYGLHDYVAAERHLREALTICDGSEYADKERSAVLLKNLAQVLKKQKRKEEAHFINHRLDRLLRDRELSNRRQTIDIGALSSQQRRSTLP